MTYLDLTLERDGFNQPWGLRMVGGLDVGAPLAVSRVIAGTASEGVLRVGDVITAIKGQDASQLSHQEATELFKNAGNTIRLGIARGVTNGSPGTPRSSVVDAPFGSSSSQAPRKTSQVGRPPARKFSDRRLEYLVPRPFKRLQEEPPRPVSLGELVHQHADRVHAGEIHPDRPTQVVQTPTSYLPTTPPMAKPKSQMEMQVEESIREEYHEKEMIIDQPYRTTPLITPGAKVKRDTPIVASYLHMHPDPQVRGAAPHVSQVSSGLSSMLGSANEQLAKKVATQVRSAAGSRPQDRPDTGRAPRIIHHQFNTPANMYSQENMANSIKQQTGIAPHVAGGPKKEFSIQNSETLKMILEEDSQKPAVQHKPKSHVVYDVHEAKRGVWPPPEMQEQRRALPPPGERPVRQNVAEPSRDLPDAPTVNQPPSMFTNSEKIAQSYTFNKLMWTVGTAE